MFFWKCEVFLLGVTRFFAYIRRLFIDFHRSTLFVQINGCDDIFDGSSYLIKYTFILINNTEIRMG